MKKIGLLLAAAAICGLAAQASPVFKFGKFEAEGLKPEYAKMLDASKVVNSNISTVEFTNDAMTRSWTDPATGNRYNCRLNPSGYLVDAFSWKGDPPTFEDLPLYIATLIIYE